MFLLLILLVVPLNGQMYMYYSSDRSENFECNYDCFDYHQHYLSTFNIEMAFFSDKGIQQIIPFCRRDDDVHDELIIPDSRISTFTFEQLMERNVTSLDLYTWLAPIDLIEHYQAFRNGRVSASSLKFYNCSSDKRFGSFCQYHIHSVVFYRQTNKKRIAYNLL